MDTYRKEKIERCYLFESKRTKSKKIKQAFRPSGEISKSFYGPCQDGFYGRKIIFLGRKSIAYSEKKYRKKNTVKLQYDKTRSGSRIFSKGGGLSKFGKFLKKQVKKAVFGHFLDKFDKKSRLFGARSLSKLVYIGALRKVVGSVGKKLIS